MDLSLLVTLEKKMHQATDFQEVWEYFLDNFGEKDEFHRIGVKLPLDPILIQAINETGKALHLGSIGLSKTVLIGIPEYGLVHGWTMIGRHPCSVLYYPSIHKGMLSISLVKNGQLEARLVRFTSRAYYDGLHRSMN